MTTKPTARRGRPPKYVNGHDGLPVVGLSLNKSLGQYYATHSKPREYFGTDFDKARHSFRCWQAEQGETPPPEGMDVLTYVEDDFGTEQPLTQLSKDHWRTYYRDLILHRPQQAAVELDIPYLADYPAKPKPSQMTLAELGDTYVNENRNKSGKPLCHQEKRQSRKWWKEFLSVVKVELVRQITDDHINAYHDWVMAQFDKGMSHTYVKHRFGKVRTIFNFAVKKGIDREECQRVLGICAKLETPQAPAPNLSPISPQDFNALLDAADVRQKAILLMALNCALKSGECRILKKDVDPDAGVFVSNRTKTGVVRCATLWKRTIRAIKAYQDAKPNNSEWLFLSRIGSPLTPKAVRRLMGSLRDKAGLSDDVKFDDIRDGAYTHATDNGIPWEHAEVLAGHKTRMADKYVKRNPKQLTADSCVAIESFYFATGKGKPKTKAKKSRGKKGTRKA